MEGQRAQPRCIALQAAAGVMAVEVGGVGIATRITPSYPSRDLGVRQLVAVGYAATKWLTSLPFLTTGK